MILKINSLDSEIMTMLANFFVKIEQVGFLPNIVIYKQKLSSSSQKKRPFPLSTSVLALPAKKIYTLESQPIGKNPPNFTNFIIK